MGKLLNAVLFLFACYFAVYLFFGTTMSSFALWNVVVGLESWGSLSLMEYLIAFLGGLGFAGMVAGLVTRDVNIAYMGLGANIFSWGIIIGEIKQRMIAGDLLGASANPILLYLFLAPLIIAWIIIILEFGRGRD